MIVCCSFLLFTKVGYSIQKHTICLLFQSIQNRNISKPTNKQKEINKASFFIVVGVAAILNWFNDFWFSNAHYLNPCT